MQSCSMWLNYTKLPADTVCRLDVQLVCLADIWGCRQVPTRSCGCHCVTSTEAKRQVTPREQVSSVWGRRHCREPVGRPTVSEQYGCTCRLMACRPFFAFRLNVMSCFTLHVCWHGHMHRPGVTVG